MKRKVMEIQQRDDGKYGLITVLTREDGQQREIKMANFGPYKTEAGALKGLKKAAELHKMEYSMKIRKNTKEDTNMIDIDNLRNIISEESDPQVAYFKLKRAFEENNLSSDLVNTVSDFIVYRDAMTDDVKNAMEAGDFMNAKIKMAEVDNFTDLWYAVDGYENYRTLTMDDVSLVIDQLEQEVNA